MKELEEYEAERLGRGTPRASTVGLMIFTTFILEKSKQHDLGIFFLDTNLSAFPFCWWYHASFIWYALLDVGIFDYWSPNLWKPITTRRSSSSCMTWSKIFSAVTAKFIILKSPRLFETSDRIVHVQEACAGLRELLETQRNMFCNAEFGNYLEINLFDLQKCKQI